MALNYTLLAETPAGIPPLGVLPNYSNPYSRGYYNDITSGICVFVSTMMVWGKVYTKTFISKNHGWEDYTIVLAWATYIAFVGLGLRVTDGGAGTHQWDLFLLPVIELSYSSTFIPSKYSSITQVVYAASICLVKVSILLQLLKIFVPDRKSFLYYALCGLIVFNSLLYTAIGLMEIFQCNPREKIWNPLIPGTCVNIRASFIFTASVNLVSDVILLVLPIRFVLQLNMSQKRKIGISVVFASGIFACISSLVRLIYSIQLLHTQDTTWLMLPLGLWCHAEVTSGILAACMPSIPRFFQHLRKSAVSTEASQYPSQSRTPAKRSRSSAMKHSIFSSVNGLDDSINENRRSSDWMPLEP